MITCGLLKDYSKEDFAGGLSEQGVKRVYRIKKRTGRDYLEPTSTLELTFNKSTPPDRIYIRAGLTERVRPYISLPRRCYKCQGYGHVTKYCHTKEAICGRCEEICDDEHKPESCNLSEQCYHCEGSHNTSYRNSQKYLMEKEILALKAKEHLTFRKAKIAVSLMYDRPGVSFASTAKNLPQHADIAPPMVTVSKQIVQNFTELEVAGRPMQVESDPILPNDSSHEFIFLRKARGHKRSTPPVMESLPKKVWPPATPSSDWAVFGLDHLSH